MAVEVTLRLPEEMVEYAKRFGEATQRDVDQVLADTLDLMWATLDLDDMKPPISSLSDDEVLQLAGSKMDSIQNERLGELQRKGKVESLSEVERSELLTLLHIYQAGQLRKSQGLAEAARRNLRSPLSP
ncbi:MAG: hypothetical protein AAF629_09000 [Chloroflexota bacterium]